MGVVAAGALGAVGSVVAGSMQSNAASQASQQQAATAQQALKQQNALFQQGAAGVQPFVNAGSNALSTLQGLVTPGSNQANNILNNPAVQFQTQFGDLGVTNQLAAEGLAGNNPKGGTISSPLGVGLSNYNQGLGSTYYNNAVAALQGIVNSGAQSAQSLLTGAIGSGNAQAQTLQNLGNAQASGTLGSANATAGGLTGATSGVGNALLMSQLLGQGGGSGGGIYNLPNTASIMPTNYSTATALS